MPGSSRVHVLLLAVAFPFSSYAQTVQKAGLQLPDSAAASRGQAQQLFTTAFNAYSQFAYGHDDVLPVSKGFSDGRNGWGASIIDAMSTMKIMGLNDLFQKSVDFASQIDFSQSKTPGTTSVFESTIRYVAGLLSAYELNGNQPQVLVDKAKQLADKLILGFDGSSPIPYGFVDFSTNQPVKNPTNIAEAGTLVMEYSTLSKYTNDLKYRTLAENAVKHITQLSAPLPGLAAQSIDPTSGNFIGGYVTWGPASDSYFEYLIKYPHLDSTVDPIFRDTWQTAVDSSIKYLLKETVVGGWSYLADMGDDRSIRHIGSHLACFYGGNWLLGGKLLANDTIVNIALKLVDACWNTYASTNTGIGPESFGFISNPSNPPPNGQDDGNFTGQAIPGDQLSFINQHGFYITNSAYILRPEVLESNFYAWRVTGDQKYLDNAQSAINNFNKWLAVPNGSGGISGIHDVTRTDFQDQDRIDDTESFFFAEVMKYLYLTFDDPNHISLDDWVFNTEAHPFRRGSLNTTTATSNQPNNTSVPAIVTQTPSSGQSLCPPLAFKLTSVFTTVLFLLLWEVIYIFLF